jgi:hypothetical protein
MIDYVNQSYMKQWAAAILPCCPEFDLCSAIGTVKDGNLTSVVLYSNLIESPSGVPISIEMSIASVDKSWCNRHNLRALFLYPFTQLRVGRVQATISRQNKTAREFVKRLGFKYEGMGRNAWPLGGDAAVYSLLRKECKWVQNQSQNC